MENKRLMSIDVLRGFDMLMIIFADRFFYSLNEASQTKFTQSMANQFSHPEWFGFHFYDIIMPLFLFVVGVVIPFSLGRRVDEVGSKLQLYPHLIKRFTILFALGWIVQGNLLHFDINKFQIFSNTLQAIAVGYLFACIAYIHLNKTARYVFFVLCLIVYSVLLEYAPVPGLGKSLVLPDKNIALYIDHYVFGQFDDGYQYTWLLSGLGFTATTLSGLFAGEILRSGLSSKTILKQLMLCGLLAIVVALLLNIWHPVVKKIWTSTFVLLTSGISFIFLAGFYWIIDVKGHTKWAFLLKVIGVNAITAYVLSHIIDFSDISKQVLFGLEQFTGRYYEPLTVVAGSGLLYLILWYMYKNQTYIKI
ncbi:acyltransferase family protein [Aestuariibaculum marinum]|uniref:DUF5009 domain-containing protein n=1 Tax=Aestuariibaculum marinum TaxID=2683592 RepID=A0A8J6Q5U4_9FLAO|nr:DUF5009 domain-containing protein [Aestuariibaculum marinum]MBD0825377.1 DUF5009 domain-containing protein [Aestuariibaculum marinum]